LFSEFIIHSLYVSTKDVFSLRDSRVVNAYHKISLKSLELALPKVLLRERVYLRIVPDMSKGIEIRFWCANKLVGIQEVKNEDLNITNF